MTVYRRKHATSGSEMNAEQWKPVVGFEGWYEVSNQGRVRSVDRQIKGKAYSSRILYQGVIGSGYRTVNLYKAGKRTTRTVHSLVAEAFIGKRPLGADICHGLNGVSDNSPSNLRYGTRTENLNEKKLHGTEQLGEKHWNSKLTVSGVKQIRKASKRGASNVSLANRFSVSPTTISNIVNHKVWKHVPC